MPKIEAPRTNLVLGLFTVIAAVAGILALRLEEEAAVWLLASTLILLAAVFYPRAVYLSMLVVLTAVRIWAHQNAAAHLSTLLQQIALPALTAAVMAETLFRLNAERRRDEAVLRKTEERFRSIFESSGMGIGILDRNGRYVTTNRALQRMLGRAGSLPRETSFYEHIHPEEVAANRALFEELVRGNQDHYQRENRYYRGGRLVWGRLSVSLIRDAEGQPQYAVAMLEDITERRRAEEALRESERRHRTVIDNIKEVIFQTDPSGVLTLLNPAWKEITGLTLEESIGMTMLACIHPDDRQQHLQMIAPVMRGEREYQRYEIRFLHRDGALRWIQVFYQLNRDAQGQVLGAAGTLYNITEKKLEEDERQRLGEQRANMIATVSHELRAPIAAMILNFDLLADGTLGELTPEQHEYVQGAIRRILDLSKTVDDLLAVSRLQDGRVKLHLRSIDVTSLLSEIYERMLPTARAHEATLELSVQEELPAVETDLQQLSHILTELIQNGLKYSGPGGRVLLSARPLGDRVVLEVADNGPGVPEEEKEHIFEPFYRSPAAMRDQIPGTGLGLNIVKQIAFLLQVEIQIRETPGGGATFALRVPPGVEDPAAAFLAGTQFAGASPGEERLKDGGKNGPANRASGRRHDADPGAVEAKVRG